jgi:hypothetical protein
VTFKDAPVLKLIFTLPKVLALLVMLPLMVFVPVKLRPVSAAVPVKLSTILFPNTKEPLTATLLNVTLAIGESRPDTVELMMAPSPLEPWIPVIVERLLLITSCVAKADGAMKMVRARKAKAAVAAKKDSLLL